MNITEPNVESHLVAGAAKFLFFFCPSLFLSLYHCGTTSPLASLLPFSSPFPSFFSLLCAYRLYFRSLASSLVGESPGHGLSGVAAALTESLSATKNYACYRIVALFVACPTILCSDYPVERYLKSAES
jgi:hypothetical protein